MGELRLLGYWRNDQSPELPDPSMLIDEDWDPWERDVVAQYLSRAAVAVQWRGLSWCRICGLDSNGSADLTDGTYFWPEGLAHYVSEHSVRLPKALVTHIREEVAERERAVRAAYERGPAEWLEMLQEDL